MKTPRTAPSKNTTSAAASAELVVPALSSTQLIRAALNLRADQFTLGDRVFDIKDLSYDSYITFIGYLTPLIEVVVQKVAGSQGLSIPGLDLQPNLFSPANILAVCGKQLPEMVQIICRETDPDITVEQIKVLAKRPTVLATAVIKQITQNGMIKDFADFFVQLLSVVKPLTASSSLTT